MTKRKACDGYEVIFDEIIFSLKQRIKLIKGGIYYFDQSRDDYQELIQGNFLEIKHRGVLFIPKLSFASEKYFSDPIKELKRLLYNCQKGKGLILFDSPDDIILVTSKLIEVGCDVKIVTSKKNGVFILIKRTE